jgi:HTH-type transcriptional regulator/antitoxin HigA
MSKQDRIAANNLLAGDVFHPGEFLSEEMEARGLKQVDLAKELGLSKTEINLVVNGKRGITVPLAINLERVLGVSAETWMNLQLLWPALESAEIPSSTSPSHGGWSLECHLLGTKGADRQVTIHTHGSASNITWTAPNA